MLDRTFYHVFGDFQKLMQSYFLIIYAVNTTTNGWKSQVTLR